MPIFILILNISDRFGISRPKLWMKYAYKHQGFCLYIAFPGSLYICPKHDQANVEILFFFYILGAKNFICSEVYKLSFGSQLRLSPQPENCSTNSLFPNTTLKYVFMHLLTYFLTQN
jgi:hypothetical protein